MAFGTPTNIGIGNNTSGATVVITVGIAGVPANALICVCVCEQSNVAPASAGSIADSKLNAYTGLTGTSLNNAQANGFGRLFYVKIATALVQNDTITYTKAVSGATCAISAFYCTMGATETAVLDTAVTRVTTGNGKTPSTTSGSPAVANELFVAAITWIKSGGSAALLTQDSTHGWTDQPFNGSSPNLGSSASLRGMWQINAGTGAKIYAPTFNNNALYADFIIGFKLGVRTDFALDVKFFNVFTTAPTWPVGHTMDLGAAGFALSLTPPTMPVNRNVALDFAAFSLVLPTPAVTVSRVMGLDAAVFNLVGEPLSAILDHTFGLGAADFTLTAEEPAFTLSREFALGPAAFLVAGQPTSPDVESQAMTTGTYTTTADYQKGENAQHGDTIPTVTLEGGTYGITALASNWNSGNLDFQALGADGSTYVSVLAAAFTANGYKSITVPAGKYLFKITTTDGIYYALARINRGAGA